MASSTAATTSGPTSKQQTPMDGPNATRRSAARVPYSLVIRAMVAGSTPATVPRQPACTAAKAPVTGSASSAGMQSATNTATAIPSPAAQIPSADTRATASTSSPARTATTAAPCTWVTK
jgi:hypothetical protein